MSAEQTPWYEVRAIAPGTWWISDHGDDVMYLLAGSERCLLVDTGWGFGDLPALVGSLCALPVTVVNTHGHPDHVLGDDRFPCVHITAGDVALARGYYSAESRARFRARFVDTPMPASFSPDAWATGTPNFVLVPDGHTFELGGRTLEIVTIPGHSPGSACLLDRANRLLLTGDSVLAGTIWLHLSDSTSVREYLDSLCRLQALSAEFDWLLPGHDRSLAMPAPLPKRLLDELVAGAESVLSGAVVGQPETTFAGSGLRADFGNCALLYRPERLYD